MAPKLRHTRDLYVKRFKLQILCSAYTKANNCRVDHNPAQGYGGRGLKNPNFSHSKSVSNPRTRSNILFYPYYLRCIKTGSFLGVTGASHLFHSDSWLPGMTWGL